VKKNIACKLLSAANKTAEDFSRTDREFNYSNESFKVGEIIPLSESTAAVIFDKTGGKKALAFYYYLNSQQGHWRYFFITDSHLLGLRKLEGILENVEKHNFSLNF
jgi:hypothetical protein